MSHHELVKQALARGVRAGTVLQDAMQKVRKARDKSPTEFEVALGELFVLASDAYKERNGLRNKIKTIEEDNVKLIGLVDRLRTCESCGHTTKSAKKPSIIT